MTDPARHLTLPPLATVSANSSPGFLRPLPLAQVVVDLEPDPDLEPTIVDRAAPVLRGPVIDLQALRAPLVLPAETPAPLMHAALPMHAAPPPTQASRRRHRRRRPRARRDLPLLVLLPTVVWGLAMLIAAVAVQAGLLPGLADPRPFLVAGSGGLVTGGLGAVTARLL